MNLESRLKLLLSLAPKKNNEGFTLIELLVVVIILGVLAAIALPNLLGQTGKAREVEAKLLVGDINQAQQAYFTQNGSFTNTTDLLEVTVPKLNYYGLPTFSPLGTATAGAVRVKGTNNAQFGTRDYVGGVAFDTDDKSFSSIIGRANASTEATNYALGVTDVTVKGSGDGFKAAINEKKAEEVK